MPPEPLTIEAAAVLFDRALEAAGVRPASRQVYASHLRRLREFADLDASRPRTVQALDADTLAAAVAWYAGRSGTSQTTRAFVGTLRRWTRWLAAQGHVPADPLADTALRVPAPRPEGGSPTPIVPQTPVPGGRLFALEAHEQARRWRPLLAPRTGGRFVVGVLDWPAESRWRPVREVAPDRLGALRCDCLAFTWGGACPHIAAVFARRQEAAHAG